MWRRLYLWIMERLGRRSLPPSATSRYITGDSRPYDYGPVDCNEMEDDRP